MALLAGTVYVSLVWLLVRNFMVAWICVLTLTCLNFAFGSAVVVLGSVHLDLLDVLYFCLLPAGIIRLRFQELKLSTLNLLIGGYVFLFVLSVARGLAAFDLVTVGNEGRGLIGEVLALTYFTTIPHDRKIVKRVVIAQIVYSAVLVLICVLHYAGVPIGGIVGVTNGQKVYEGGIDRALPAGAVASIELAILFAASWAVYRNRSRWLQWLIGVFIAVVIVLQHRTVWVMLAITLAAAALIDARIARYLSKIGGAVTVLACIVLLAFIGLRTQIVGELQDSATNTDTLQWRFEGLESYLADDQSPLTVLIGMPIGSGYLRLDSSAGGYTNFQPHNEIVNQYLRVGIFGALLLILYTVRPIYIYFRDPNSGSLLYPTPASWILVTIGVIVFSFPYSYSVELFALVAMANGLIEAPAVESFNRSPALAPRLP
ncbi:MAG: hypothetical protein ABR976_06665 [Terracidiphilus sp.]|jgi:hypothetical protein